MTRRTGFSQRCTVLSRSLDPPVAEEDGQISRKAFTNFIATRYKDLNITTLEQILTKAVETGYIEEILFGDYIRPSSRIGNELPYLQVLAQGEPTLSLMDSAGKTDTAPENE